MPAQRTSGCWGMARSGGWSRKTNLVIRVAEAVVCCHGLLGAHLSRLDYASLQHGDKAAAVLQNADIGENVAVDNQDIGKLAPFQGADLVVPPHDLGARFGGARDRFQRRKADVLDEEAEFAGIGAVRAPGEAVVAAHAEAAARLENAPRAFG